MLVLALLGVIGLGIAAVFLARNAQFRDRRDLKDMPTYASGNARGLRIPPDEPDFRMEVGELPDPDPGAWPEPARWRARGGAPPGRPDGMPTGPSDGKLHRGSREGASWPVDEKVSPASGEATPWPPDEETPLPPSYGKDVTVALVRAPRSVYVYWDRAEAERELRRRLGEEAYADTVPVLRVWHRDRPVRTIQVHEHDDHWFLHDGLEPGQHYSFSYERMTRDGRYYPLSRSGPITLPYDTPGPQTPEMLYRHLGGDQPGTAGSSPR